jgi:polygalacturonase
MYRLKPATLALAAATLPVLAAAAPQLIDATKAGVAGDGVTLNTASIQRVIDAAAANGGGIIDFPAGRYLTGTIELKSHVTLRLEKDAVLLGSTNPADYRNLDPFIDGSGNPMGHALIVAIGADHAGIEGSGTVDGQGPLLKAKQKPFSIRPFLLRWVHSSNITVRDVHLTNPGAWTLNFFDTNGALVDGVTIRSRGLGLHNNDGVNIDSSQHIRISNCDVDSGDDALVIKSTGAQPSRDIVATGCKLSSHTNAIKLGTESYGGFEDISVSDCQVTNTDMAGIALYEVDGAPLRRVTISDVTMDGVTLPISIRLGARLKSFRDGQQARPAAGTLSDVLIKNVSAKNIKMVGMLINGVPGHPVERLTLRNVRLELPGGGTESAAQVRLAEKEAAYPEFNMFGKTIPAYGIYMRHARDITFDNVQTSTLTADARPATQLIDVEQLTGAATAAQAN